MPKNIKVCKDFTYASIIREAILSSKDQKATSSQIFVYIVNKHPTMFKESNSMTWKGNIRQLLSKNPEFVKLKKDEKSKLHYWKYVPIEDLMEKENEMIFQYHPLYVDGILGQPRYSPEEYYAPNIEYQTYFYDRADSNYTNEFGYNPLYVESPYNFTKDYIPKEGVVERKRRRGKEVFDYSDPTGSFTENLHSEE